MDSALGHCVLRVVHLLLLLAVVAPWHVEKQAEQRLVSDTAELGVGWKVLLEA